LQKCKAANGETASFFLALCYLNLQKPYIFAVVF